MAELVWSFVTYFYKTLYTVAAFGKVQLEYKVNITIEQRCISQLKIHSIDALIYWHNDLFTQPDQQQ